MSFTPLLPLATLLRDLTAQFHTETSDYMEWRSRLERLRSQADELRRRIVEIAAARRGTANSLSDIAAATATGDEKSVDQALNFANELLHRADMALSRYDPSVAPDMDAAAAGLLECGLRITGRAELPDYFAQRPTSPFRPFWEEADDLYTLMEAICRDDLIDHGVWLAYVTNLRQRVAALYRVVRPLQLAANFDPEALDGDQHFVLAALQDGLSLCNRADDAIRLFHERRRWLVEAKSLKGRPPILPCHLNPDKPPPYIEDTERLWLYKWVTAEAYAGLSGGTIYNRAARNIDEERCRLAPHMGYYDAGPTLACDIVQRQSDLNMRRLLQYFKRNPMTMEEVTFCDRMRALHFCLFHATDAGAHLIHRQEILSLRSLRASLKVSALTESDGQLKLSARERKEQKRAHLRFPPKVKSSERNLILKGDADFTFFRLDISTSRQPALKTRYGSTTFLADAECLFNIGWISLHDQVYPFKEEKTRRVGPSGGNVRILVDDGAQEMERWRLAYGDGIFGAPPGKPVYDLPCYLVNCKFQEEIFYGADVIEGVLLSLVRELRRVAGLGLDADCGTLQKGPVSFTNGIAFRNAALLYTEIVDLRSVMSAFFRVEAKIPCCLSFEIVDEETFFDRSLYTEPYQMMRPVPAMMFHELGDGRYFIADKESDSPLAVETHVIGLLAGHSYDLWDDETRGRADSAKAARLKPAALYWNQLWYLTLWDVPCRDVVSNINKLLGPIQWDNYAIQGLTDPRKEGFSALMFSPAECAEIRQVIRVKLAALGVLSGNLDALDVLAARLAKPRKPDDAGH
ncbi:MAG: hypothetical protein HYX27_15470 [Acidobacteria bacterium]|nr:hypothetical protein [Acidobacteriota bacterium]